MGNKKKRIEEEDLGFKFLKSKYDDVSERTVLRGDRGLEMVYQVKRIADALEQGIALKK